MLNASLMRSVESVASPRCIGSIMCRNPLRTASFLIAISACAVAAPALAWPFGGGSKPAAPAATNTTASAPAKASAAERAAADRLDPLKRVAF